MKSIIIFTLAICIVGLIFAINAKKNPASESELENETSLEKSPSQHRALSDYLISSKRPVATHPHQIRAYLRLMEEKGHDFEIPIPTKHILTCSEQATAEALLTWAQESGFDESYFEKVEQAHSYPEFRLTFQRTAAISVEQVDTEARTIANAIVPHANAHYTTWATGELSVH